LTVVEPPARTVIAADELRQIAQIGYCIADGFLDADTVLQLIRKCESLEHDERASRVRRGVAFARRNLLELDFIRELVLDHRVQAVVDAAAPGSVAVRAILFDKTGPANWTVPWHQDRSIAVRKRTDSPGFGPWSTKAGVVHVQPPMQILQQMLTLSLHLDACWEDNGPLRVVDGSHERLLNRMEIDGAVARGPITSCTASAGGLLLMRPLLLHASSPARNPSHRRVIHLEFGPAALPGGVAWAMSCGASEAI
jgi:ectoine hydroxylase-related dioxygenase (phytanoyl-CoA dioxygenase family)